MRDLNFVWDWKDWGFGFSTAGHARFLNVGPLLILWFG